MDRIDTIRHRLPRRPACIAAACMATALALAACNRTPDIPFAEYGDGYADKPDFAEVEYRHPLSVDDLQKLTPENIKNFDQEQLDQIYARLSAGPIPDGAFDGDLVFPKGRSEEHTSELQSLMCISYAVFCLKKKNTHKCLYIHQAHE